MFAYSPDETIYPLLSEKSDFQGPSCWEPSLDHATPSFDIRLWLVKDINRFLWSLFSKRNRSWKHGVQFHDWKSNSFDLLTWKVLSFTPLNVENEAVNKCSYLDLLQCWLGFWLISVCRFPHFRFSTFPGFCISGLYIHIDGFHCDVIKLKSQNSEVLRILIYTRMKINKK